MRTADPIGVAASHQIRTALFLPWRQTWHFAARSARPALTWLLACLLFALLALTLAQSSGVLPNGPLADLGLSGLGGSAHAYPALPDDVATTPLAAPAPAPAGSGGYALLEREDDGSGRPVRWDPCRPIHYVIREHGAPAGGDAAVSSAIDMLEQIMGLRFVFDGYTSEPPVSDRPAIQTKRYGDRWAPVLVAWTDAQEYPAMSSYAGLGGPDAVSGRIPGRRRFVSGVVLLNRVYLGQTIRWNGGRDRLNAVVLHEFGHLAGLDHVDDRSQLMYQQPSPKDGGFADGDRRGLAALSGGPCFRDY
jgi:hypothetical protein